MKLRLLRLERSMTQKELAETLQVTQSTVSQWERGEREPGQESLVHLADFFGVSIDFLIGRSPDPIIEDHTEVFDLWDTVRRQPDIMELLELVRELSPAEVKRVIRIVRAIDETSGSALD